MSSYSNLTKEEWDQIAQEYREETRSAIKKYHFFSVVQRKLEATLKERFAQEGIKLVRDVKEEDEYTMTGEKPGLRYLLYFMSDPTQTPLLSERLNFTELMREINLAEYQNPTVPDYRIVRSEFLNEKINEVCNKIFEQFKNLFMERLKIINERSKYVGETTDASF